MDTDVLVRKFMEGDTTELPEFYARKIRGKLGPLWDMLPEGATMHDHHAYLNSQELLPIMPLPLDPSPVIAEAAV